MDALNAASVWTFNKLTAQTPGMEIWPDHVGESGVFPAVVYDLEPGSDLVGNGAVRVWTRFMLTVRAIDRVSDYYPLRTVADKIDLALDGKSGERVEGYVVYSCVRTGPFRLPEVDEGVEYRSLGGIYKLIIGKGN